MRPNIKDDKFGILNVTVIELKNGKLIGIKIQVIDIKDMEQRACFIFNSQLSSGERHMSLKPSIIIIIKKHN